MTFMFISLQQWGYPPNENNKSTEVFSKVYNNIGHDKIDQCRMFNMKYENIKYQSTWGVSTNIIRSKPRWFSFPCCRGKTTNNNRTTNNTGE